MQKDHQPPVIELDSLTVRTEHPTLSYSVAQDLLACDPILTQISSDTRNILCDCNRQSRCL